jgi:pimeloyl-ACP methyl ester carboxylesterase
VGRLLDAHRAAGRTFRAAGTSSFVRTAGEGEAVVLLHGLPASSFLYRKVIDELAWRGFMAASFDLPGLGFADRPPGFDYTFAGLGRFAIAAVDALSIERFHLVVHDAGGPVGFQLAAAMPARVRSLTILDTVAVMGDVPFPMEVYARLAAGRSWAALPPRRAFQAAFRAIGLRDRTAMTADEIDVYRELVLRADGGAAYLEIMRNLHRGAVDHRAAVDSRSTPYPVQVVWGAADPVLSMRRHGWKMRALTGVPAVHLLPGKHYLQEDCAPAIAELVARFAGGVTTPGTGRRSG